MKRQPFANNSRCIATFVLGFLSGKCHAATITLRLIRAASSLPIYLCVPRAESLLMASNTSYFNVYGEYCICALFIICKHLAVFVPNPEHKGSTLLYFD
jgi:hypothetical protein